MNGPLFAALVSMGIDGLDKHEAWKRIVVVRNFSPVPTPEHTTGWGFKFLVLGENGLPQWFGRCGWASPSEMHAECALLDALCGDQVASAHVPASRSTEAGPSIIQVSRHLGSAAYERELPRRTPEQWTADLSDILKVAELVMHRAQSIGAVTSAGDPISYRRAQFKADWDLLVEAGVPVECRNRWQGLLLDRLDELPAQLQHGDLWPANVLRAQERWWLIDFTECGLVWLPGFDLFTLLQHAPQGFSTSWIAPSQDETSERWSVARRKVMSEFALRNAFSWEDMGRLALHYLVRIAAYRLRPGIPPHLSLHWLAEIRRVDAALQNGTRLEQLTQLSDSGTLADRHLRAV